MKTISMMFVAALSISSFGCKKGGGGDCDSAINHSMDLSKKDMKDDAKMMKAMADVAKTRCKEDKWDGAVLKCMNDAKTEQDAQACYGKLTKEQQDKMEKAAMDAASAAMGSAAMTPPPPPPPSGDMAGSAAAPAGSAGTMAGSAAAPAGDMAGSAAAPAGSADGSAAK